MIPEVSRVGVIGSHGVRGEGHRVPRGFKVGRRSDESEYTHMTQSKPPAA